MTLQFHGKELLLGMFQDTMKQEADAFYDDAAKHIKFLTQFLEPMVSVTDMSGLFKLSGGEVTKSLQYNGASLTGVCITEFIDPHFDIDKRLNELRVPQIPVLTDTERTLFAGDDLLFQYIFKHMGRIITPNFAIYTETVWQLWRENTVLENDCRPFVSKELIVNNIRAYRERNLTVNFVNDHTLITFTFRKHDPATIIFS